MTVSQTKQKSSPTKPAQFLCTENAQIPNYLRVSLMVCAPPLVLKAISGGGGEKGWGGGRRKRPGRRPFVSLGLLLGLSLLGKAKVKRGPKAGGSSKGKQ